MFWIKLNLKIELVFLKISFSSISISLDRTPSFKRLHFSMAFPTGILLKSLWEHVINLSKALFNFLFSISIKASLYKFFNSL